MKYRIDQIVAKIAVPVLVLFDGKEQRFENGTQAAAAEFDKNYLIDAIYTKDSMIVVALKENHMINDINWCGENEVSFF